MNRASGIRQPIRDPPIFDRPWRPDARVNQRVRLQPLRRIGRQHPRIVLNLQNGFDIFVPAAEHGLYLREAASVGGKGRRSSFHRLADISRTGGQHIADHDQMRAMATNCNSN